jgi:hypothetical protein
MYPLNIQVFQGWLCDGDDSHTTLSLGHIGQGRCHSFRRHHAVTTVTQALTTLLQGHNLL